MPEPKLPVIPEYITVHLGKPKEYAQNVQVSFRDYIKNVASSEIYPTWPETSIRANVYAQITFALNRIYTEWYRSKGYNFDITNSTQFDQAFNYKREIFDNISVIVDEIFNDYVVKQGSIEPYFTQFCNGTTVTCPGLSQWGTVDLANRGYNPYQILTYYYGNDIDIVDNAPVENIEQSYEGIPLKLGMSGNDVLTLQLELNRIRKNFPAISRINSADGIFGVETEKAVKDFQRVFNLNVDGVVGKSTWYKIKDIYNAVKKLSELASEGVKVEEVTPIYQEEISLGARGIEVKTIQYYLNAIAYFNELIPLIEIDGVYGKDTENAVSIFQEQYGLPITGVVDGATWYKIQQIYNALVASLPAGYEGEKAELFPGYTLKKGMTDRNVEDIQTYLSFIAKYYDNIPTPAITGYFGDQTYNAVIAFQREFGLPQTGIVGPVDWGLIAKIYDELKGF